MSSIRIFGDKMNRKNFQEIDDGSVDTGKQYSAALWVYLSNPRKGKAGFFKLELLQVLSVAAI